MDAHTLAQLDDDAYNQTVNECIHTKTADPEVWAALTSPELLDRTHQSLTNVFQRVSTQIRLARTKRDEFRQECFRRGDAGKKDWFESLPDYESWRNRAGNFQAAVQARLSEVGKIRKNVNRAMNRQNHDRSRNALRELATAVRKHQAAHAKAGGIAQQCDYELWRLLDEVTVPMGPEGEPTSLRTMLDFYWVDVETVTAGDEGRAAAETVMRSAPAGQSSRFAGMPRARHVGNDKALS